MLFFIIVIAVCGLDQLSKMAVVENFSLYQSLEIVPGLFNLTYVTNRGGAFSMLADIDSPLRNYFFVAVKAIAVLLLTFFFFKMRKKLPWQSICLALIAGGALGNLIDRIRTGAVIDFLDFYWRQYHWPAFNVADSAICVGVIGFLVLSFIEKERDNV